MRPADFRDLVHGIADRVGLPRRPRRPRRRPPRARTGGATPAPTRPWTGPRPWSPRTSLAGFTKIHLDCSMVCAGDPTPLPDDAGRRARRPAGPGRRGGRRRAHEPRILVYVIGTEVPVPGGAHETLDDAHRRPRRTPRGRPWTSTARRSPRPASTDVWHRVIALVVQPGVEFDHLRVVDYDRAGRPRPAARSSTTSPVWSSRRTRPTTRPRGAHRARRGPLGGPQGRPGPDLRAARGAVRPRRDRGRAGAGRPTARAWPRCVERADARRARPGGRATTPAARTSSAWPAATATATGCATTGRTPRSTAAADRLLDNLDGADVPLPLLSQHLPDQYAPGPRAASSPPHAARPGRRPRPRRPARLRLRLRRPEGATA